MVSGPSVYEFLPRAIDKREWAGTGVCDGCSFDAGDRDESFGFCSNCRPRYDKDLDVVIANGRHWPQQNFLFLNQDRARFNVQRNLGIDRATTYATELADLDGDGDVDIAVGNDWAPNLIFLNDGTGKFDSGTEFGDVTSVRSLTLADLDRDNDIDIVMTCRGRQNRFYLNNGKAKFGTGYPFGGRDDSTIDVAVADFNLDGHPDLVLAESGRSAELYFVE